MIARFLLPNVLAVQVIGERGADEDRHEVRSSGGPVKESEADIERCEADDGRDNGDAPISDEAHSVFIPQAHGIQAARSNIHPTNTRPVCRKPVAGAINRRMPLRAVLLAVALVAAACSSSVPTASEQEPSPTTTAEVETEVLPEVDFASSDSTADAAAEDDSESLALIDTEIPEGIPTLLHPAYDADAPRAFNGRVVPVSVDNPEDAAELFTEVERALRVDGLSNEAYADLGHTEQLVVRTLIRNTDWIPEFLDAVPEDLRRFAELHIEARQELGIHVGDAVPGENVPPWEIIEPAPIDELVDFYKAAADETGIDWGVLAGVNLVETVVGRINGVSTAGAQGPMQFLPTTWPEVSQGGNVLDPEDSIHGAARYLVQRGGLDDINQGLWGYNNSFNYGNAVLAYAELIRLDERAFRGIYNWEVYVGSVEGTLWLPVGFDQAERIPAADYVAENPWVRTLDR